MEQGISQAWVHFQCILKIRSVPIHSKFRHNSVTIAYSVSGESHFTIKLILINLNQMEVK